MTLQDFVIEYILKLKLNADYIFTLCSYGSVDEGSIRAREKCNKILEDNSHKVNYSNRILTADNFLPAFDMKKEKSIKKNDKDIVQSL